MSTRRLLIKRPESVDREVRNIVSSMFPYFDFSEYEQAFCDVHRLFIGEMHGYEACDTVYHDWSHTVGVLLATARLLHGLHLDRHELSPRIVNLTLISSLFHDAGYIRRIGENHGSGAQFTREHIQRSIDLLEDYTDKRGWSPANFMDMEAMIQCTDTDCSPDAIVFTNIETMLAAHVLGTADIISQMADDVYLEKLPLLYREFTEGGITEYSSEYDLFAQTRGFHALIRSRLEGRLSNVIEYVTAHFKERHGIGQDLYSEAIQRNMDYLECILTRHGKEYCKGLRRKLDRAENPTMTRVKTD